MGSFMDYAYPAGDESGGSGDEWDVGLSDKKTSYIKVTLIMSFLFISNRFMLLAKTLKQP